MSKCFRNISCSPQFKMTEYWRKVNPVGRKCGPHLVTCEIAQKNSRAEKHYHSNRKESRRGIAMDDLDEIDYRHTDNQRAFHSVRAKFWDRDNGCIGLHREGAPPLSEWLRFYYETWSHDKNSFGQMCCQADSDLWIDIYLSNSYDIVLRGAVFR